MPATRVPSRDGDAEVREKFRRVADRLDLQLEEQPVTSRLIGIAVAMAAHATVDVDGTRMPRPAARDGAAIRRILTAWSSMHPDDVLRKWKKLATHPYITVGDRGMQEVNHSVISKFVKGREMRMFQRAFELYKPRRIKLSGFKIVYIGRAVAAATYHERETSRTRRMYIGNAAAILLKKSGTWRIAVLCKQGLFA